MEKKYDVIGMSLSCVDILNRIPAMPPVNTGAPILQYSTQGGGKVASGIVASARLGAKCAFITVLGDCPNGKFMLQDFKDHGIDTSHIIIDEGKESAISVVLSDDATHSRTIFHYPGTARKYTPADFSKELIASARILHISDCSDASFQAAKWAKESGVKVLIDADKYTPELDEMIHYIDYFIASEFYYESKFQGQGSYEENARKLKAEVPEVVLFTLGEKGVVGVDETDSYFEVEGFSVEAVDTTGAGDVYHGAYAYAALQEDWTTPQRARFCNAVSAIKCTRMGGRAAIPTREVALRFIETGEIDYSEIDQRVERYRRIGV